MSRYPRKIMIARRTPCPCSHNRSPELGLATCLAIMILRGYLLIVLSILLLVLGSYAVFFSALLPASGIRFLDKIAQDTHYKYMAALILPISVHFVIPNWVGWQYYRNS